MRGADACLMFRYHSVVAFTIVVLILCHTATGCDPEYLKTLGCPHEENGVHWAELLVESCKQCGRHLPCKAAAEDSRLTRLAIEAVQSHAPSFRCIAGMMAAYIVVAQLYLVKPDSSMAGMMEQHLDLSPFPFHTAQFSLYTNMIPAHFQSCDNNETITFNKYVPKAHLEDGRTCGIVSTDSQLIRRCRSRRKNKVEALAPSVRKRDVILEPLECPGGEFFMEEELAVKLKKYTDRADSMQCQDPRGMWRNDMSDAHKCVLVTIGHLLDFRPGDLLLDWGSGCGHKVSWAKILFDVDGLGVELVDSAVAWADEHSIGRFCQADGRDLRWVPDGVFDHVISFAALYHLPKLDQCETGVQLIQKLRVGGRAYFGWNQGNVMDNLEWMECFNLSPEVKVEIDAIEDAFIFPANPDRDKTDGNTISFLFQYPAYSLFLTRLA